jgi:hypothetical protein
MDLDIASNLTAFSSWEASSRNPLLRPAYIVLVIAEMLGSVSMPCVARVFGLENGRRDYESAGRLRRDRPGDS